MDVLSEITVDAVEERTVKSGPTSGSSYAIVRSNGDSYFAWSDVAKSIIGQYSQGDKLTAMVRNGARGKTLTKIVSTNVLDKYAALPAKPDAIKTNARDRSMFTRYILDTRNLNIKGEVTREEAYKRVLESWVDAGNINEEDEVAKDAIQRISVERSARRNNINTESKPWTDLFASRQTDLGSLQEDMDAVERGDKEVKISTDGRIAFVQVKK